MYSQFGAATRVRQAGGGAGVYRLHGRHTRRYVLLLAAACAIVAASLFIYHATILTTHSGGGAISYAPAETKAKIATASIASTASTATTAIGWGVQPRKFMPWTTARCPHPDDDSYKKNTNSGAWAGGGKEPTILFALRGGAVKAWNADVVYARAADGVADDLSRPCHIVRMPGGDGPHGLDSQTALRDEYVRTVVDDENAPDGRRLEFLADGVVLQLPARFKQPAHSVSDEDLSHVNAVYATLLAVQRNDASLLPPRDAPMGHADFFSARHAGCTLRTPVALLNPEITAGAMVQPQVTAGAAHMACWHPTCDAFPQNVGVLSAARPSRELRPNLIRFVSGHCIDRYQDFAYIERRGIPASMVLPVPSSSMRIEYLQELHKHVFVHSSGSCFHTADSAQTASGETIDLSDADHASEHFLFEFVGETVCYPGRLSEKMLRPFMHGAIPVVLGTRSGIEYTAPSPDAFIHVDDFPSARALAAHLRRVATDEAVYRRYHRWRELNFAMADPAWLTRAQYNGGVDVYGEATSRTASTMCDYLHTGRHADLWQRGRMRSGDGTMPHSRMTKFDTCHYTRAYEGSPSEPRILVLDFGRVDCAAASVADAIGVLLERHTKAAYNSVHHMEKRVCWVHDDARDVHNAAGIVVRLRDRHSRCPALVHDVLSTLLGDNSAAADGTAQQQRTWNAAGVNWYNDDSTYVLPIEQDWPHDPRDVYSLRGFRWSVPVLLEDGDDAAQRSFGDADIDAVLGGDARTWRDDMEIGSIKTGEAAGTVRKRTWLGPSRFEPSSGGDIDEQPGKWYRNDMVFVNAAEWRRVMAASGVRLRPLRSWSIKQAEYDALEVPPLEELDSATAVCRYLWHREDFPQLHRLVHEVRGDAAITALAGARARTATAEARGALHADEQAVAAAAAWRAWQDAMLAPDVTLAESREGVAHVGHRATLSGGSGSGNVPLPCVFERWQSCPALPLCGGDNGDEAAWRAVSGVYADALREAWRVVLEQSEQYEQLGTGECNVAAMQAWDASAFVEVLLRVFATAAGGSQTGCDNDATGECTRCQERAVTLVLVSTGYWSMVGHYVEVLRETDAPAIASTVFVTLDDDATARCAADSRLYGFQCAEAPRVFACEEQGNGHFMFAMGIVRTATYHLALCAGVDVAVSDLDALWLRPVGGSSCQSLSELKRRYEYEPAPMIERLRLDTDDALQVAIGVGAPHVCMGWQYWRASAATAQMQWDVFEATLALWDDQLGFARYLDERGFAGWDASRANGHGWRRAELQQRNPVAVYLLGKQWIRRQRCGVHWRLLQLGEERILHCNKEGLREVTIGDRRVHVPSYVDGTK